MTQTTMFAATSLEAFDAQTPDKLSGDCRTILDYVRSQGEHGATRWEIHRATDLQYATCCGRCFDLVKAGRLANTGRKRKTGTGAKAFVLVAVETQ